MHDKSTSFHALPIIDKDEYQLKKIDDPEIGSPSEFVSKPSPTQKYVPPKQSPSKPESKLKAIKNDEKIALLRFSVLLCLVSITVIAGYFSFSVLKSNDENMERQQFETSIRQLQESVTTVMNLQVQSMSVIANLYRMQCPMDVMWPNCSVPIESFNNLSINLIGISNTRAAGFSPIISTAQVSELESYAYEFYEEQGYPNLGITNGVKGIYCRNGSISYHCPTASTKGKNAILVPIVQIGDIKYNARAYMFNLYSEPIRIANIDYMLECSRTTSSDCTAITDIVQLVQDGTVMRPASLLHYPIRAPQNSSEIIGMSSTVINWDTALSQAVSSHVTGIDVVLKTERDGKVSYYTFDIDHGEAHFVGKGDLHDKSYTDTGQSFPATPFQGSAIYTITVYESQAFNDANHTDGPMIACIISVVVIFFTSVIFICYDLLMNRSAMEKELIIQTRRQFVKFISHEIRTPMNTIALGMKLFTTEVSNVVAKIESEPIKVIADKLNDMLDLIRDVETSSQSAIVILNDLINYDKLQDGGLKLEVEDVYIWELVRLSIRPFLVQAKQVGVTIDIQLSSSSDRFRDYSHLLTQGDKVKIGQIIRNLVSNALKFTPYGGVVTVSAIWDKNGLPERQGLLEGPYEPAGAITIAVKDSGVGMTLENQRNLFQEGVQFDANKLQGGGGSGLGLFIARGIAELHQGTLEGASEGIGLGSTFSLKLPVYTRADDKPVVTDEADDSDEKSSTMTASDDKVSVVSLQSYSIPRTNSFLESVKRILLVDDSPLTRKMVSKLLVSKGFEVDVAADGATCIQLVAAKYDPAASTPYYYAILMDSEMPDINGKEVTAQLRASGYRWPIIGVTGHVLQADIDDFIAKGATMVLAKPLDFNILSKGLFDLYKDMLKT